MAKAANRALQPWEAKWVVVPTMNHNRDSRLHLCVSVKIADGIVFILPTSTKPVEGRTGQRPVRWGGVELYPATNRVFTMPTEDWVVLERADAHRQPDRELKSFLKQELNR